MKYTLEDKVKYNKSRATPFSRGYCLGVQWYGEYPKLSGKDRKMQLEVLDITKQSAKGGDRFSKGIMCGIRDAANERKAKKR